MKVAVISFSGNVGKTMIARHLLASRISGARVLSIESINSDAEQDHVMRARQFAELQEYLQVFEDVVVDIGASNVEELLALMRRYRGSHEDFNFFIVPTVPAGKQQQDTMATLVELSLLGVPADKVRLVFNMVEDGTDLERVFEPVLAFLQSSPLARVSLDCRLATNEIYGRAKGSGADLSARAADRRDYKALIAATRDSTERLALAQRLATHRLASGVVPELDACFAALHLHGGAAEAERRQPSKGRCREPSRHGARGADRRGDRRPAEAARSGRGASARHAPVHPGAHRGSPSRCRTWSTAWTGRGKTGWRTRRRRPFRRS